MSTPCPNCNSQVDYDLQHRFYTAGECGWTCKSPVDPLELLRRLKESDATIRAKDEEIERLELQVAACREQLKSSVDGASQLQKIMADYKRLDLEAAVARLKNAGKALLDSLGEYVRQSMYSNPEWKSGIAAMQLALTTAPASGEGAALVDLAQVYEDIRPDRGFVVLAMAYGTDLVKQDAERIKQRFDAAVAHLAIVRGCK
jgi:hypothetical protein